MTASAKPRLILVHGAWVGPWEFEPILPILTADGWEVETIELASTGSGDGLDADAAVISAALDRAEGPVVLVAHSFGGVPVTLAGDHPAVERLVYVAAFALDEGESVLGAMGGEEPPFWGTDGDMVTMGRTREERVAMIASDLPPTLPPVVAEQIADMFRPQSRRSLTEELGRAAAWRTKPVTYILTENDKILPPPVQEMLAARSGAEVVRIPHGHNPFAEDPVAFAALLAGIAATPRVAT
jgi:pimeloyl-ACP methyl ester carboxylesterase